MPGDQELQQLRRKAAGPALKVTSTAQLGAWMKRMDSNYTRQKVICWSKHTVAHLAVQRAQDALERAGQRTRLRVVATMIGHRYRWLPWGVSHRCVQAWRMQASIGFRAALRNKLSKLTATTTDAATGRICTVFRNWIDLSLRHSIFSWKRHKDLCCTRALQSQLADSEGLVIQLQEQLAEFTNEAALLQQQLNIASGEVSASHKSADSIAESRQQAVKQLAQSRQALASSIAESRQQAASLQDNLFAVTAERDEANRQLALSQSELAAANTQYAQLVNELEVQSKLAVGRKEEAADLSQQLEESQLEHKLSKQTLQTTEGLLAQQSDATNKAGGKLTS